MPLAEMMDTQKFDPNFMGQLIICLGILLVLAQNFVGMRRKPSMDVDLTRIEGRLQNIEEGNANHRELQDVRHSENRARLDVISQRLQEGDVTMAHLQTKQAVNSESIKNIEGDVHELKTTQSTMFGKIIEAVKQRR